MEEKKGSHMLAAAELLKLVEERLAEWGDTKASADIPVDPLRLLHELKVQQIELKKQNEQLLKSREEVEGVLERYADLFDVAPVGYFTLDRAGTIRNVNLTGADLIGIGRSRLIGKRFGLFLAARDRRAFSGFIEKVFAVTLKESCELKLRANGKSRRFVRIEALADPTGDECRIAMIDITERKHAQELLQVRIKLLEYTAKHTMEELLRKTLDEVGRLVESPIGFYHFVEPDQKTLSLQAWSTLTTERFCKAEGNGLHYGIDEAGVWVECVHQRRPVIHNDYSSLPGRKGLPDGHAPVIRELVVPILRDDLIVAILGVGNKPWDYTEEDVKTVAYLADVAWEMVERKRAEDVMKDREARFRSLSQEYHTLLDSLPDGIVQIDPEHRVIWANLPMMEMVKEMDVQLMGNCCFQPFWNRGEICESCPVAKSFRSGEPKGAEIRTPDGRLMELRAVPIRNESGEVESVIQVFRDLTGHRELEAQLRQAQKMESIGTLAGGIAHDFNNILTAIIGYGYLALLDMGADDPHRQKIEFMLEGAERATRLTKDLLLFSRRDVSEKRPVDLNEIVGRLEKFLVRIIGEDVVCSITLHGEPLVVHGDPHQIEQVLMNIATNARDAMAAGGELKISTKQTNIGEDFVARFGYGIPGRYALLTISDTGAGMDKDTVKKIFEPFFTTKVVGKGTGLGMAVAYGIVKQHDGYIDVNSKPGAGAKFRIYLPLISSEVQREEMEQEEIAPVRGNETILLAEDDDSARDLIKLLLKQEGYTVIEAVDGRDAVKKFMDNRESIQLLISDLIMPNMSGKEAYDEMTAWRPELKAIFVSGYAPDEVREKMMLESGILLIPKPVMPKDLLLKVRRVLDDGGEEL